MAKANKLMKLAGVKVDVMPERHPEEMKHLAREALHTITKAEEHRKDKELMRHVKHLLKNQTKAICK
jgi:hypothetical protein